MHKTVHLTWQLKAGVSTAAMMAAAIAFMPGDARAQSCTVTNNLQGVANGTVVTCPSSDQLAFPGAVDQGPFTVPNGSTLFAVTDGNNPPHQQWGYTDPNGNNTFVFLDGRYDLINGIGGTTLLEGSALISLAGAGSCGVGGLICPGYGEVAGFGASNETQGLGGGVGGGIIYPYGSYPPTSYPGDPGAGLADNIFYDPLCGEGSACGVSPFFYGPTIGTTSLTEAPFTRDLGGDITIHGVGFADHGFASDPSTTVSVVPLTEAPFGAQDTLTGESDSDGSASGIPEDLLRGPEFATSLTGGGIINVDPQVRENFEACEANFGNCSLIVNEGGGSLVFYYPPSLTGDPVSGVGETTITAGSSSLTVVGQGFDESDDDIIAFEAPRVFSTVPAMLTDMENGGTIVYGGPSLTESRDEELPLVDVSAILRQHDIVSALVEGNGLSGEAAFNITGTSGGGAASTVSIPSIDGSAMFTSNGRDSWAVSTPIDGGYRVSSTWVQEGGTVQQSTMIVSTNDGTGESVMNDLEFFVIEVPPEYFTVTETSAGADDSPGQGSQFTTAYITQLIAFESDRNPDSEDPLATSAAILQIMLLLEDDPITGASRANDFQTAGVPEPIFQDGFSSGNTSSWSRSEDP